MQNQQKFGDLIDEIYDFKAKLEEEKRKYLFIFLFTQAKLYFKR